MLREIGGVGQRPNEGRRRWFRDDYFDIFTWQEADGAVNAFQLCYEVEGYERSLTWSRHNGYTHNWVDNGGSDSRIGMSPILRPDGVFPLSRVVAELDARGIEIDPAIRAALREKIQSYPSMALPD